MSRNIFILDDDPRPQPEARRIFETEGFTVYTSTHWDELSYQMLWNAPDVLFVDVSLPSVPGPEKLGKTIAARVGRDIPIVVISKKVNAEAMVAQVRTFGATGWLTKPFTYQKLAPILANLRRGTSAGQAQKHDNASDRRRATRYRLIQPISVRFGPDAAQVTNLSRTGSVITHDHAIRLGIPRPLVFDGSSETPTGRVVWSRLRTSRDPGGQSQYISGVEVLEQSAVIRSLLERLIATGAAQAIEWAASGVGVQPGQLVTS